MARGRTFPYSPRRGGCAIKKKQRSILSRADGNERSECKRDSAQPVMVVINFDKIPSELHHHPGRSIRGSFATFYLLSRPPLLGKEGKFAHFDRFHHLVTNALTIDSNIN